MTKVPASLATLSLIFAVLPLAHTSAAEAGGKAKVLLAEEAAFDGTGNDAIKLGDLALKAPATLSFSIKPGDTAPDRRILSQADGEATQAGALRLAGGHLQIWNGGGWLALLTRPLPAGEWTDIALVFGDESTVTALQNGKADPAVTSRADFSGAAATLGGKFLGQHGDPFLGSIKSVRIENRAIPFEASKAPKTVDWKSMMTVAERKRDAQGQLQPLQSYDETIRRGMEFLLKDHLKWFKGPPATLLDEQGNTQMPWVYYSNLQQDGTPFAGAVDGFVSYPAFHHALLIRTFIGYSKYANDARALKEAVKLADWDIAHSTPADWPYAGLPYSTFAAKKPGGFRDGSGLMPDKAAIMALAYLQLHEATREKRFLQAAEAIATTLGKRQRPNGTWPFRVDPKTEAVIEDYSSSVIYAVMLFEKLDKLNGNHGYQACRDRTWNWLLNGPIKTKEFRGFYEDIPASKDGRTNYDCLDTIRYLLANRTDTNGYLEMAKDLNTWVEKTFMDKIQGFEPAEGIREQLQCNVVMGIHSLNWASMLLDLAKATGDEKLKQRADQTANYITYYLQPDNRIVVGFQYNQWWYSCHAGVVLYLFDFAGKNGS